MNDKMTGEIQTFIPRVEERWGLYSKKHFDWALGDPPKNQWTKVETYPFTSQEIDEYAESIGVVGNRDFVYRSKLIEVED